MWLKHFVLYSHLKIATYAAKKIGVLWRTSHSLFLNDIARDNCHFSIELNLIRFRANDSLFLDLNDGIKHENVLAPLFYLKS